MDKILTKVGVSLALFLMILELSYVNAKSLLYLVDDFGLVDKFFAIVGAMAFSMVTVLVMRKGTKPWMKVVFPIFDTMLVFGGFNIKFADNLLSNPIAFGLTVFMAIFTGLITYSLGKINYNDHAIDSESYHNESKRITEELQANQIESERIIRDLETKLSDSTLKVDELNRMQLDWNQIRSELNARVSESSRNTDDMNTKLVDTIAALDESRQRVAELEKALAAERDRASKFLQSHILYEAWIGKKKSAANRNGHEESMSLLADSIKSGKRITVEYYLQLIHDNDNEPS